MAPTAANLHDLDYRAEAATFTTQTCPIIDIHTHLRGARAVAVFREAADCYGVEQVLSMTPFEQVDDVRRVMGDRVRFIAVPDWRSDDPAHAHGAGFTARIEQFASIGAPLCKFWAAPRARDYAREMGDPALLDLNGPVRRAQIEHAAALGMGIMTHIADPDTWFRTTYADSERWGTKAQQYDQLEAMLEAVPVPWLAAHMGGSPEDLDRLDLLLERHSHLHLDTSATKWMVREMSRHDSERIEHFLRRWRGRICFGSDIVTQDEHLERSDDSPMSAKATTPEEAFDLYASRFWALRTLWERTWRGPSPIADPDLHLEDETIDPMASPTLQGHGLPDDLLESLYRTAAEGLLAQLCCAA